MSSLMRIVFVLSIPALLMVQFYQGYRHTIVLERRGELEELQKTYLQENKKILAGISVYNAPARIYRVATEILGLKNLEAGQRILVDFSQYGGGPGEAVKPDSEKQ